MPSDIREAFDQIVVPSMKLDPEAVLGGGRRRRRRQRLATGAAVVGLSTLAGATVFTAANFSSHLPVSSSTSSTAVKDYGSNRVLNARAQQVVEQLTQRISSDPSYGGIAIITGGIEVSAVAGGSSDLRAAVAQPWGVPISVRSVKNSLADQEALTRQLDQDAGALRRMGIPLVSWGPDYEAGRVKINLESDDESARQQLIARYGAERIVVNTNPGAYSTRRT